MPVLLFDENDSDYEDELSERFRLASRLFVDSVGYEEYIESLTSGYDSDINEIYMDVD